MSINKEMNILIVGNGFDLAHYLPTKYDHFMGVMQAIEAWDISKGDMQFDDLFGSFYEYERKKYESEKEKLFFSYTKAMYKTEEVKLTFIQIEELQKQLKENVWYQYFSDHVKELKTWIDFETKIEEALEVCCEFFERYDSLFKTYGEVSDEVFSLEKERPKNIRISGKNKKILTLLAVFKVVSREDTRSPSGGGSNSPRPLISLTVINEKYLLKNNKHENFQYQKLIDFLHLSLESFIKIFNLYLLSCVQSLNFKNELNLPEKIANIDQIFSFNYTNTYNYFYKTEASIDFLHGKSGDSQNMVLGISDISHKTLKGHKAYGFVKYHQKLMKDTDYRFILHDEYIQDLITSNYELETIEKINIDFWGHSLDVSDRNYIEEVFSLNDKKDLGVRVRIYFYDANAKFSMLANLIHILGNHKIETWMKKGWLKFEPVPNIAEVNKLEPVSLKT